MTPFPHLCLIPTPLPLPYLIMIDLSVIAVASQESNPGSNGKGQASSQPEEAISIFLEVLVVSIKVSNQRLFAGRYWDCLRIVLAA